MASEFTYSSQTDYVQPTRTLWTSSKITLCQHRHGWYDSVKVGSVDQPVFNCYDCGTQMFIRSPGDKS